MSVSNESVKLDDGTGKQKKVSQHRLQQQQQSDIHSQQQNTGMTPSIITTINNTSPNPPDDYYPSINYNINNNNCNTLTRNNRRINEPYESYIEDSFVGHWEREDDDPNYAEYVDGGRTKLDRDALDEEEDSALQHPSTIEFDFDSFGPESIIYTPSALGPSNTNATTTSTINTTAALESLTLIASNDSEFPVNHNESSNDKETRQISAISTEQPKNDETHVNVKPVTTNSPISTNAFITRSADYLDPTQIDLKVIEPYKKVISHAGYCHHFDPSIPPPKSGEVAPAVIVFSACYLPDRSRHDYNYVMDHLFLYVLNSLHELIADDYILIYLHNTQPSKPNFNLVSTNGLTSSSSSSIASGEEIQHSNNLPTFTWMKRCYQIIDRKLRKNLKILYLVKPTFWLKTIVIMCKPFISSKFSRKLRFVENMDELKKCLPVDELILPASADNI